MGRPGVFECEIPGVCVPEQLFELVWDQLLSFSLSPVSQNFSLFSHLRLPLHRSLPLRLHLLQELLLLRLQQGTQPGGDTQVETSYVRTKRWRQMGGGQQVGTHIRSKDSSIHEVSCTKGCKQLVKSKSVNYILWTYKYIEYMLIYKAFQIIYNKTTWSVSDWQTCLSSLGCGPSAGSEQLGLVSR